MDSCANCLKKCDVFNALSKDELDQMYSNRYQAHYRAGEVIVKQGTPISHLVSISEGLIKLVLETPGESDIILGIEKAVFLITGPGIFMDKRYHFSVVALTNIEACFIDVTHLHEFVETNHQFAKSFYGHVGERSVLLYNRIRSLNQKNMAGRVSEAMIFLYKDIHNTNPFPLVLNRQEIADYTGITKESVSRILKEFKEEKILEIDDHQVHILNLEKLESISQKG